MMSIPPLALHPPPPHIRIRPANSADLNALMTCCWQNRTPDVGRWLLARATRNRENKRGTNAVILNAGGKPIGYGQLTIWTRCAEISDLVVDEGHRSQGYGTALIQYLVGQAREMKATCAEIGAAESNPRALALYRRLGFEESRIIQMNLGNDEREPVIYLQLKLNPPV